MFAGNFAPVGWLTCDGSSQPIAQYDVLYSLIGTTYGGDGQTTFNLPDLRGRTPIHQGAGPGLTPRTLGELTGTETVSLTGAQMPAHFHPVAASSANADTVAPTANSVWAVTAAPQYATQNPNASMSANATLPAGSGQPHENMMPFTAVSFIIATAGIFPPRP